MNNKNIELRNIIVDKTALECYICFDRLNQQYISLQCCNKLTNKIHDICLLKLYLNSYNDVLCCPLCRSTLDIKEYLSERRLKNIYCNLQDNEQSRYKDQFDFILSKHSNNYKLYILSSILIIFTISLFIYFVISLISLDTINIRYNHAKF